MPQLDFVGFHYTVNTLSVAYLSVYVVVLLFLLKPIFKEFFLFYKYPTTIILSAMLLANLYAEKVVFTSLPKTTPDLSELNAKVRKRWDSYKYIPKRLGVGSEEVVFF
jgi:hypothetical protein